MRMSQPYRQFARHQSIPYCSTCLSVCVRLCVHACECVVLAILAVYTKELAVTSDQEAYHSCFQDLISRGWAKLPLGRQFSFFLIGALIKSEKHIVFAHLKAWHYWSVLWV